jgi:hypothetical protein
MAVVDDPRHANLVQRIATLRHEFERSTTRADALRRHSQELKAVTAEARRARWRLRYDRTLARKLAELGDLDLHR